MEKKLYFVEVDICEKCYAMHYICFAIAAASEEEAKKLCVERHKGKKEYFHITAVKELQEGLLGAYMYYE